VTQRSDVVLERLNRLHPKIIDLSLGRIERLLEALGRPQDRLAPVVHIGGTNGKGSVTAFLRALLEAEGRRVHVYTSPHLVRFHERIRLAGELIDETELVALLEECEAANGGVPITFFEITTAAALLAFVRQPAEATLLEVGLGGRLDATNVIARPRVCVITPVSIDHTQYLGEGLEVIAFEKAGIMKPGVPCVVGRQPAVVRQVLEAHAAELGTPLLLAERDWRVEATAEGFVLDGPNGRETYPKPKLLGAHQTDNAGQALVVAGLLGELAPGPAARRRGLAEVHWPARLQRLSRGPLVERLPVGWELWLDGGHNQAAGETLARELAAWRDKPLYLVLGMLRTKAVEDFLAPLVALTSSLRAVSIPGEPATLSAEEAAGHARACGYAATASASLDAALGEITATAEGPGRILICGSLYLAGKVLAENG
jgi:dihydrofolate synthase/folylpolyglutamate synthase